MSKNILKSNCPRKKRKKTPVTSLPTAPLQATFLAASVCRFMIIQPPNFHYEPPTSTKGREALTLPNENLSQH